MPQPHSGWLTILPTGHWYLKPAREARLPGARRKRIVACLGPFAMKKEVYLKTPPLRQGGIRTKIRFGYANNRVVVGPLIGILTVGDGTAFRGNRENFKDIFLCGKRLGALVFVFTPGGIDWERKHVSGFVYDEKQNGWLEMLLPFPNVVYNRVPTRRLEQRHEVRQTLDKIAKLPNVTLFNRRFFNKHVLFQTLKKLPDVSDWLPETGKLDSLARLKAYCAAYPFVYLKPVRGKAGQGIMRLEPTPRRWYLRRVHAQKSITRYFPSLERVWQHLRKRLKNQPYIIQQGIPLARYKGRPFDIRVLVQKNGTGEWGVTGIGIRQAGANSITTHVPRGGTILSPDRVLTQLFGDEAGAITAKIERTALTLARSLNREIADLAEMSMDLGLTREGRLWFFEANAKPEKFDEPAIRRSSLANLIRYAQYVSRLGDNPETAAL